MRRPAVLLVLMAVSSAATSARASDPQIRASDVIADVQFLSSPALEGRGALTRGLADAGGYVARRFAAARLQPAGEGGTYFQAVAIPLPPRAGGATRLVLGGTPLVLGRDFSPNLGSTASRAAGRVAFVGYGVVVPGRYDDFAGIDVRGKLVVCLRGAPAAADLRAGAALSHKLENAIARGAIGLAIVDTDTAAGMGGDDAAVPLPFASAPAASGIASLHLRAVAVDRLLLAEVGETVATLRARIDQRGQPASFELPIWADFAVEWTRTVVAGRNVVAVLEGSDPSLAGQAVLVGAHYDHLGHGDEGSALDGHAIHPGADDNASGTAALLEIAEALAAEPRRPRRSIVFVAFTGEEKGLQGSAVAAARGPGGRELVGMLNLDMVGRMRGGAVEVGGAPTSPAWRGIVEAANQDRLTLDFPSRVVPNSDHASFLMQHVPALFLFTGMHGDYHRASDTWDKVNADGVVKVAALAQRIARAVADRQDRLSFAAPQWTRAGAVGASHGVGVRLGIRPDYGGAGVGLGIVDVIAGGPAAVAGLEPGDVIERLGGNPVTDIDSYMEALASFQPGDQAVLSVRRQGTTREVKVRFGASAAEPQ
jgi:hypothetical protein